VLGVNAWMQAPVGFEMADGRVVVTDPIAIFKHPLWAHMAIHSTLACYIAVAFAFAGWYAWRVLRGRADAYARSAISVSMLLGSLCAVAQPLSGDFLAKYVFRTQPVKFAAMEGQYQTQRHAPLRIGGWPDDEARETRFAIEIPGGLSYLATGDPAAEVPGLDRVPPGDRPNVELTHFAFQIMVGSGMAMLIVSVLYWFCALRHRGGFVERRWILWAMVVAAPLGFVGLEAGWFVTEVGRQPWIIQGEMRTSDAVTPAAGVGPMFFVFSGVYALLGVTVVVLLRRIAGTPVEEVSDHG
jgi:cytochrome bd ubiquinol oxidase subunit I